MKKGLLQPSLLSRLLLVSDVLLVFSLLTSLVMGLMPYRLSSRQNDILCVGGVFNTCLIALSFVSQVCAFVFMGIRKKLLGRAIEWNKVERRIALVSALFMGLCIIAWMRTAVSVHDFGGSFLRVWVREGL